MRHVATEIKSDSVAPVVMEREVRAPREQQKKKRVNQKEGAKLQYKRRTIEFHPEIEEIINMLQEQLRLRSHTDVLQKAVQVLYVLTGNNKTGKRQVFISRDDGNLQELLIL